MGRAFKPQAQTRTAIRRCAIYTRKSSEEGLEQAFHSLDAQREACDAYIRSQRHEGWGVLPTLYDDGGISGGTLERPALRQLLADIQAGKVDLVVVYKVDRLTRSLADFAKIVDVFDAHGASFVSVTQQFNTTTSMGRLTLNMLLSFAQFEREVTGERIRDKIAASKRKGMWMGGSVPLGYDVQNRLLVINPVEAKTVRSIFTSYLDLGSVRMLKDYLDGAGVLSKLRPSAKSSKMRGGRGLSRGALYLILQNRIYRGEISHQGNVYKGEHQAIIDEALWDAVQQRLAENRNEQQQGARAASPSLLTGLLYDEAGARLVPTHATKKGRRYRYYISKHLQTEGAASTNNGLRIPASDLERIVTDRLLQFLSDRTAVFAAICTDNSDGTEQQLMLQRSAELAANWMDQPLGDRRATLRKLLRAVIVEPASVAMTIPTQRLVDLLLKVPPTRASAEAGDDGYSISLVAPVRLKRAGVEIRLIVQGPASAEPDPTLIRLLGKAHALRAKLVEGGLKIGELAEQEGLTSSYVTRVVRLSFLAPDITSAILKGRQPISLTANRLLLDSRLPLAWAEQRTVLGFT